MKSFRRFPSSPGRILVVPLRFIGDTILTVPLIRNLRYHFPEAQIDVLASRATATLLEPCPYVQNIFPEAPSLPALAAWLYQSRYDAVFILRKSFTMALACRLAGIPHIAGYDKQRFPKPIGYKRWGLLLDYRATYPSLRTDVHQAVSHLGLLRACGLEPKDDHLELWPTEEDEAAVEHMLTENGVDKAEPMAVIHTVSASHGKTIDPAKYAPAIRHLHESGYQLLSTGTAEDYPQYDMLARQAGVLIHNFSGKTSLRETFALYKRVRLILTVDSGPIHMAAAANVPEIVGVYGPTNEKQWAPHSRESTFRPVFVDLPCRPCYAKVCSHNNCRVTLTGDQILDAVREAARPSL